jgi:hypothetical protein
MIYVKRIFCISTLLACAFSISQASAEIYRCQAEQGDKVVFTDNRFSCHLASAQQIAVKPQTLRIERKVLASIPDLSQRDPLAGFPAGGRKYCAPVAVSNSLSAVLPEMMGGLPNTPLFEQQLEQRFEQQVEIARSLGSADYMATGDKGTDPAQLLSGVDRYLSDQKKPSYKLANLEYRGQRSVPRKYNPTLDKQADLPWLIQGINQEKHIWLNIGWYQTVKNGENKRIGGHWVTLVGYERFGSLKDSEGEYLMINDPATRGGDEQEKISLKLTKLNGIEGYQLVAPRSKPKHADMAWIEGAIQLAL